MTVERKAQMSKIMGIAHNWRRQIGCTLSEALKVAWGHVKASMRPRLPITYLKSPVYSPTSWRLAAQPYGRTRDRQAGRSMARVGW